MKFCPVCNGSGMDEDINRGKCKTCLGTGNIHSNNVQMPKNSSPNGTPNAHFSIDVSGNEIWEMCDAIVLCSGGMDSVTLAHYVKKQVRMKPVILFFNYGQKTLAREWAYAQACANDLLAPFVKIHMSDFARFVKSAIVTGGKESMKTADTVVPGRNLMFISMAVAIAQGAGIQKVYIGVQTGDNVGYPDCRPDFWSHVTKSTNLAYEVNIYTPFIHLNKKEIVSLGKEMDVDYCQTWSCYFNNVVPCGKCPSCLVRMEAFK